jgi:hypothetical protein
LVRRNPAGQIGVRDEREERLVDEHALEDFAGVVVLVTAGGHRMIARRRDLKVDRLAARAGCGF